MRIDEQFVARLLDETSPLEAVSQLSQFWSPRFQASLPKFGLSNTEYEVELCSIYYGDVLDGGHFQYFTNGGTRFCDDTLVSLNKIGLNKLSAILSKASKNLPRNIEQMDLEQPSKNMLDCWANADEMFDNFDHGKSAFDIDSYLLNYLRKNRDDILIKERGK